MTLAVGNVFNHMLADGFVNIFLYILDNRLYYEYIRALIMTADIIYLTRNAAGNNHIDSLAVVLNIKPVAYLHTVAVYRQVAVIESVVHNKRNKLFGELVGTVVVGAAGNINREFISISESLNEEIRACL